jgi:hypothetical protein
MADNSSFSDWAGFELGPDGFVLEQVIDLNGEIGFAYERSCQYYKDFHTHSRTMLVFPRGAMVKPTANDNSDQPITVRP